MPMLPFITCTINFYAMAFIPLLLASPDYFDIDKTSLGKATAMTLIWASLLPQSLIGGAQRGISQVLKINYSPGRFRQSYHRLSLIISNLTAPHFAQIQQKPASKTEAQR